MKMLLKMMSIYHMMSGLGVINTLCILKSINHWWFTELVTLHNDVHYNVAGKIAKQGSPCH